MQHRQVPLSEIKARITGKRYWVTIEEGHKGTSLLPLPLTQTEVVATWMNTHWADQVIGLPALQEAKDLHELFLHGTTEEIEAKIRELEPRVERGEILLFRMK